MREVKTSLRGISCQSCARNVKELLLALGGITEVSVDSPFNKDKASVVTVFLDSTWDQIPDEGVLASVRSVLPPKYTSVSLLNRDGSEGSDQELLPETPGKTRQVRRFRCGCANQSCCCSKSRVLPEDEGVLIWVMLDTPERQGCQCGAASVCKVDASFVKSEGKCTCKNSSKPGEVEAVVSKAKPHEVKFTVKGMTCSACVAGVQTELLKVPGVQKASVALLLARATLQVDPAVFQHHHVIEKLAKSGYEAEYIHDREESNENDVYLRFSTVEVAEKAADVLQASEHVLHAEVIKPRTPDSNKSDLSGKLWKRCCGQKQDVVKSDMVKVSCRKKLNAVESLDAHRDLSYEVVSRNDPALTGEVEPIEALRSEAKELFYVFKWALFFTLPLALAAMVLTRIPKLGADTLKSYVGNSGFRVVDIITFVLATPVQFVLGFRFYRGSWYALRRRTANMDVLIALGTTIAYMFSVIVLVLNTIQIRKGVEVSEEGIAFETSAVLITIVLLGKWIGAVAKKNTAIGVEGLSKLAPREVNLVAPPPAPPTKIREESVNVELVSVGDHFLVNAGASFPLDGTIVSGNTTVDESMLTGESWPASKEIGDPVYAGTINGATAVTVRCTETGPDSMLQKIIALVKRAQESKPPIEEFADRVSGVFVGVVLLIALGVTVIWFILAETKVIPEEWVDGEGSVLFAILFGLSVLVISCPCALGLATPTALMVATSLGARKLGILYKDGGEAIQAAQEVKAVLFDKTGTLTLGAPTVTTAAHIDENGNDIVIAGEESTTSSIPTEMLRIIAAAEAMSDHPLAKAIVAYAETHAPREAEEEEKEAAVPITQHESVAGKGIRCTLHNGKTVLVGRVDWVRAETDTELVFSSSCEATLSGWEASGRTIVLGRVSNGTMAAFGIEDPVRDDSAAVISFLQKNGIRCGMVTGDSAGTAKAVAEAVGITENDVFARTMPEDKVQVVRTFLQPNLQSNPDQTDIEQGSQAQNIAFVGDGINDAAALSAAAVGIAMGSGSQIAAESAGIVLVRSRLWDVVVALDLARKAFNRIKLNYVWALGYNSLGIPLAAGVLYPWLRTRIPPYAAAAAMGLSSVSVVLSSLSLNFYKKPSQIPFMALQ